MATIPAAPKEGGTNQRELLFLTEGDGASGLRAVLLRAFLSEIVNGQRVASMGVERSPAIDGDINAITSVIVSGTHTPVLPTNESRRFVDICHDGPADHVVYLMLGAVAVEAQGYRLNPSGTYRIGFDNRFVGQINAICPSGTVNLTVQEG